MTIHLYHRGYFIAVGKEDKKVSLGYPLIAYSIEKVGIDFLGSGTIQGKAWWESEQEAANVIRELIDCQLDSCEVDLTKFIDFNEQKQLFTEG